MATIPKNKDKYWPSKIVAQTRVYLASIYAGEFNVNFYYNMLLIVKYQIHRGYFARDKEITLNGIKDFIYNLHYGLGVRDLQEFMLLVTRLAVEDTSVNEYAKKFLDWLRFQDPVFAFPNEVWEYRRLLGHLKANRLTVRQKQTKHTRKLKPKQKPKPRPDIKSFRYLKVLFHNHPEELKNIGKDRKYRNVYEAAFDLGLVTPKSNNLIRIKAPYSSEDYELTADEICNKLGVRKSKLLLREMIEWIKKEEASHAILLEDTTNNS